MALGGFEALFDPFYYEDSSLCYEAWKRGWSLHLIQEARTKTLAAPWALAAAVRQHGFRAWSLMKLWFPLRLCQET